MNVGELIAQLHRYGLHDAVAVPDHNGKPSPPIVCRPAWDGLPQATTVTIVGDAAQAMSVAVGVQRKRESGWPLEVAELQADGDTPGLWIGFQTDADRQRIMELLVNVSGERIPPIVKSGVQTETASAGWAIVTEDKGIDVRTVSDSRRAAIVNYLIVYTNMMVMYSATDEEIEERWAATHGAGVEVVKIVVDHSPPRPPALTQA